MANDLTTPNFLIFVDFDIRFNSFYFFCNLRMELLFLSDPKWGLSLICKGEYLISSLFFICFLFYLTVFGLFYDSGNIKFVLVGFCQPLGSEDELSLGIVDKQISRSELNLGTTFQNIQEFCIVIEAAWQKCGSHLADVVSPSFLVDYDLALMDITAMEHYIVVLDC